jgi:hypothetical protein
VQRVARLSVQVMGAVWKRNCGPFWNRSVQVEAVADGAISSLPREWLSVTYVRSREDRIAPILKK